jgi:hypothetical protein
MFPERHGLKMGNPRRIRVRVMRDLAEAWEQEVRRLVTLSASVIPEARVREPLGSSVGGPTLAALASVLDRTEGWELDANGVYRHAFDGGYIAFDPGSHELEIVAHLSAEASGVGEAAVRTEVSDSVEAEAAGTYYEDGWGGRSRSVEAKARRDQARRKAEESAGEAVRQEVQREADAMLASAAAAREEELRRRAAEALVSVGFEGRAIFQQALAGAYRDAILAYARARDADGIQCTDSSGVLDIEFRTADLSYQEAGGGVRTRFRYRPDIGEVELFEVQDLYAGSPPVDRDARLDRAAAEVARIVESNARIEEVVYPAGDVVYPRFPHRQEASGDGGGGFPHWEEQAGERLAHERATDRQLVPPDGGGVPGDVYRGPGGGALAVRRYLRARCPERVPVGRAFSVLVSIVQSAPAAGELKPFDVPSEGRDVLVALHAPGLRFLGDQRQPVHVPHGSDSEPVMFELQAETPGPTQVSVTAWLGGSYLGELLVEVTAEHDGPLGPDQDMLAEVNAESAVGAVSLVSRGVSSLTV